MTPKYLKVLYTGAAIVLGGMSALHVFPQSMDTLFAPAITYLVLHSYLPSAKTGSPQG